MDKNINESDFEWTDSVSSDPLQWVQPDITLDNVEKENLTEGFYYKGVNPTVDLIVIRGDKVLLIQRDNNADAEPGKWALPGGFHDTNAKEGEEWKEDKESSLDAAKREVKEETGLDVDSISGLNFEMVGVYKGGGRDPRDKEDAWTRSTVYMVHIPEDEGHEVKGMDDAQRAEWVPLSLVLSRKLAFDHHKIIEKALTMNESDAFSNLGLLTESFYWTDDIRPQPESPKEMIHVGAIYKINPERSNADMLLRVYDVTNNDVHYDIIHSDQMDEPVGEKGYVTYDEALRLLNKKKTWDHNPDGSTTERELGPYWLYRTHESIKF
jgi:ADP-ribose pyrophosphatase YjhB (NUDIX family)